MRHSEDKPGISNHEYCFPDQDVMMKVLGPACENLSVLMRELKVTMGQRGLSVYVNGETELAEAALRLIGQLTKSCRNGRTISEADVVHATRILAGDPASDIDAIFNDVVCLTARRKLVTPKGLAQKQYVDAMRRSDITFAIGPAGTGKTYLAVAVALAELLQRKYRRIVLTRPAIEAGEKLGFLPGDMIEKINPYLRPLYDALEEMVDPDKKHMLLTQGQIEIAPLAFMRGRTLNDSFVILDEAQNTTREQMKMFLTRLGFSSRAVVTGDVSQIDLPDGVVSGLVDARQLLYGIDGMSFVHFSELDVVRHPLVKEIIRAYDGRTASEHLRLGGEKNGDAH